ncbi:MAG TPA: ABC transporter substrate-binding protein [Candidatus Binatia bacterium]
MFLQLLMVLLVVVVGWLPRFAHAQTLRISYSGVSGQNLPFWVTYEAGLYKKYGLNVEMVLIAGGLTNMQAMMANEIQFSYLGGASPIQAIVQGADLVILGTAYGLMPYGVIASKNIHAPAELKGKRIAVSRLGGIEETAARLALDQLGVGARNVTFLQAGPDPVRIAALESGAAQATMLAPPGLFVATGRGLNMLADLGNLKIKYPTSVIPARRPYLAQNRATVKKFLMAMVEGLQLYRQNKNFAVQVLQKYTKQATPEVLSQTYEYFSKNTPVMPLTDAATIQAGLPTDKPTNRKPEEFYDNSILEELTREGFVKSISK